MSDENFELEFRLSQPSLVNINAHVIIYNEYLHYDRRLFKLYNSTYQIEFFSRLVLCACVLISVLDLVLVKQNIYYSIIFYRQTRYSDRSPPEIDNICVQK